MFANKLDAMISKYLSFLNVEQSIMSFDYHGSDATPLISENKVEVVRNIPGCPAGPVS